MNVPSEIGSMSQIERSVPFDGPCCSLTRILDNEALKTAIEVDKGQFCVELAERL